jgi:hypothetical protein
MGNYFGCCKPNNLEIDENLKNNSLICCNKIKKDSGESTYIYLNDKQFKELLEKVNKNNIKILEI